MTNGLTLDGETMKESVRPDIDIIAFPLAEVDCRIDAFCVGESGASVIPSPAMQLLRDKTCGHGNSQMRGTDECRSSTDPSNLALCLCRPHGDKRHIQRDTAQRLYEVLLLGNV